MILPTSILCMYIKMPLEMPPPSLSWAFPGSPRSPKQGDSPVVDGWPLSVTGWKAFAYMERCLGDLKLSAD